MFPSLNYRTFTDTSRFSGSTARTHVPRMYYQNFDDNITAKFGVILQGWPLKEFKNPSGIKSRAELQVLKNSLESGATYFKRLTPSELAEWEETRFQARTEETPTPQPTPDIPNRSASDPNPDSPSDPSPSAPCGSEGPLRDNDQEPSTRTLADRTNDKFVNLGVTAIDGTAVMIYKKARKQRSDKGKKRATRSTQE